MTLRITPEERRRLETLHLLEPLVPKLEVKRAECPRGYVRVADTFRRKSWLAKQQR